MSKEETKTNQEMMMLGKDQVPSIGVISLDRSHSRKLLIVGAKSIIPDLNIAPSSESEGEEIDENAQILTGLEPQDANHLVPKLLYELEVEVFARVSCTEYWKLLFINKQFSQLLQSSEIFRVRREWGLMKPYVFMRPGGDDNWIMFDQDFENFKKLPELPSDYCFFLTDKETIIAGTQLIVIGREVEGVVMWRYELEKHKWFKGPEMITPRVMYASASCGSNAFFAGGIKMNDKWSPEVVNIAEKYNADTKMWTKIHEMHKRRKFCSGCFLHGRFYVIGGLDENDEFLTCGECYNEVTDSWKLIPNMLKDMVFMSPQSPPLIAVVNEHLYLLETSLNELHVYDINENSWKKLGIAPVRADSVRGWGVAFKSLGDRLLLIGALSAGSCSETMAVFTCRPSPNMEKLTWKKFEDCCKGVRFNHFIHNCCVMFA